MWILFGNYNFSQHRFCGWFFSPIFLVWQNVPSVEFLVSIICGVQLGAIKHIRVASHCRHHPFPEQVSSCKTETLCPLNRLPRWRGAEDSTCRCRFDPCVGKIPWRRKWQPTPEFLAEISHGQRSLVGCILNG